MTPPPDKLDLRNCDLPALCEWVAREIMGWERNEDGATEIIPYYTKDGESLFASDGMTNLSGSLDAVAAVRVKAWEGRLKGHSWHSGMDADGRYWFQILQPHWSGDKTKVGCDASHAIGKTQAEAELRSVALAWQAAGKEGR